MPRPTQPGPQNWMGRAISRVLPWPNKIPVFNRIENVWKLLKDRLDPKQCRSIVQMKIVAIKERGHLEETFFNNCILCVPVRMRMCRDNGR